MRTTLITKWCWMKTKVQNKKDFCVWEEKFPYPDVVQIRLSIKYAAEPALPTPVDSLGSVMRFVYAALLLCTSDNYCYKLRYQFSALFNKKRFRKIPNRDHFWSFTLRFFNYVYPLSTDGTDCVVFVGPIFFRMAVLRFSLSLCCPWPPSWILMLISFKKCVSCVIFL